MDFSSWFALYLNFGKTPVQKIDISLQQTNIIKGLAIIAVVLLHILAYPKGIYHGQWQIFFVGLDQLARFCVPAFIMLSGYGLAFKAQKDGTIGNYWSYLKNRLGKLLPLYLLWSFSSILIVKSVPAWSFGNQPSSMIVQLLLGQADYQLYFLPVIFQLYALFPLIWRYKHKIDSVLLLAWLIQIGLYAFYNLQISNSDRYEYVFALSWIGYFVLGIYLKLASLPKLLLRLAPWLTFGFFAYLSLAVSAQIRTGLDPLPALKFTKLIIIPFALLFNLTLLRINFDKAILTKPLTWLGQNSYLIFLAHTIALRFIYALLTNQLSPNQFLGTLLLYLATLYLHQQFSTKNPKPQLQIPEKFATIKT